MDKPTATQTAIQTFEKALGGKRFIQLFAILREQGLEPLGKSNTDTLLFQYVAGDERHNVLAFRHRPEAVISFPATYWASRASIRSELCKPFDLAEMPQVSRAFASTSIQSAGQVAIKESTMERLKELCLKVCSYADSQHA
ncbi:TPA: hypothetical protein ACP32N_003296 [Pseudomonas aeruginosa]